MKYQTTTTIAKTNYFNKTAAASTWNRNENKHKMTSCLIIPYKKVSITSNEIIRLIVKCNNPTMFRVTWLMCKFYLLVSRVFMPRERQNRVGQCFVILPKAHNKVVLRMCSWEKMQVVKTCREVSKRIESRTTNRTRKDERKVPKRLPPRPCRLLVFPPESKQPELQEKNYMLWNV